MADYRLRQSGDEVQNILDNAAMRAQLTTETERAQQAEQQLQTNIESEAQARQGADATLQQHIDAEASARQQGDSALNQLIQQVQASLINYYLKTETYSATQIDQMLAAIKQFRYQVVDVLPTPSAETMGIIYLVPSAHAVSGNIKDEYITLTRDEGSGIIYYFEQIGETAIDLSNYYTKAQTNAEITAAINAALAAYYTSTQTDAAIAAAIATAIANYYTKSQVDALIANFITKSVNDLVNYYLKSETFTKAEVNQLIAAVQQFTYQSVTTLPTASADTMNKIYLVPSTNPQTKNVKDEFITIAVTDQGTTTYSWEQIGTTTVDLSGYSTTEQMNAAIANAIATALANYYTKSQTMTSAEIEAAISAALLTYSTTSEMNTAISNALNTALASYSTTTQMNTAIATAIANYYTKTEVDALIANFITKSVNDLVNYYLKSDTYTKAEVHQLIDAVKQFTYVSVAELPTASADTMNKIYLVPSTNPETKNVKDEYITIAVTDQGTTTYSWEQIGSTTVDLSGYYTSAQTDAAINTALAAYSTTTQMQSYVAGVVALYYTKTEVDALIANFITKSVNDLVNYYLKSDTYTKAEVQQLIDAVKQFTYVSVAELPTASADTMNKIYLVPSANPQTRNVKDEFITIAVTDQGTTTYSWEMIGSTDISLDNYYTKAQTDAAITAALNAALADYSTTTQVGTMISTAINTALAQYYNKTQVDNIANTKTDKLTMTGEGAAVEDDIMVIDENGNIKDGGKKISDLQLKVTDCAMLGGGFPTCTTAGGTAAKTVSIPHFLLLPNCRISVLFQNAFTATNPTLSINSGAAIAIRHFGRAMEIGKVHANTILTMVYDGTYWQVVGIEGITGSTPSGAVDLALPSGLLWCEHNVGASTPYEHGLYFSWGNVEGHAEGSGYDFSDAVYAQTAGAALTGDIAVSNTYDMVRHNMGAPWRLPTMNDFVELNANCDSEWTDEDGVAGRRFTSRINGNSIFFPASGRYDGTSLSSRGSGGGYWSSTWGSETNARYLGFNSASVYPQSSGDRRLGFTVRAVQ